VILVDGQANSDLDRFIGLLPAIAIRFRLIDRVLELDDERTLTLKK